LTGQPAGARDPSGAYAADTINGLVDAKLRAFAQSRRAFGVREGGNSGNGAA
jgi:hypothetical protein